MRKTDESRIDVKRMTGRTRKEEKKVSFFVFFRGMKTIVIDGNRGGFYFNNQRDCSSFTEVS